MIQHQQTMYFRIGSFVITGLILIVIAILVLGSGVLFKRVIHAETYFKESVQGLSIGSPVKYLGMDIGTVEEINAVGNIYPMKDEISPDGQHTRYIYVKMALSPKFFANVPADKIKTILERRINHGLRVKIALQGLTGNAYLELAFVKKLEASPSIPVYWQPENYYIPSATSTLAYFTDNAQYLLNELRKIDFKKTFDDADVLINNADEVMQRTSTLLAKTNKQIHDIVGNVKNITANMDSLSEQAKTYPSRVLFGNPPPRFDPNKLR